MDKFTTRFIHKHLANSKICRNFVNEIKTSNAMNHFIKSDRTDEMAYRAMLQEAREGSLIKIRKGVYGTIDSLTGGMIDIERIIPGGIVCLYSAWHIYQLTTQIPNAYYVAISRKRKATVPEVLDIKLVYQSDSLLNIGVAQEEIEGIRINIYNRERCVCDAIKYRNKIGIDVMAEILDTYLKYDRRNLPLLTEYAKKLRVFNTLITYLNVKL